MVPIHTLGMIRATISHAGAKAAQVLICDDVCLGPSLNVKDNNFQNPPSSEGHF